MKRFHNKTSRGRDIAALVRRTTTKRISKECRRSWTFSKPGQSSTHSLSQPLDASCQFHPTAPLLPGNVPIVLVGQSRTLIGSQSCCACDCEKEKPCQCLCSGLQTVNFTFCRFTYYEFIIVLSKLVYALVLVSLQLFQTPYMA